MAASLEKRFWNRVQKTDTHWFWIGLTDRKGYGIISVKRDGKWRNGAAHRVSWELHRGPIPDGLYVLHDCPGGEDVHGCVNPDHLFLGTHQDNMKDASLKLQMAAGERNHFHKLTKEKVLEIQKLLAGGMMQKDVAKVIGVCKATVQRINKSKTWKYLIGVNGEHHQKSVRNQPVGEKCSYAKLTDAIVMEIIRLYASGVSDYKISQQFGVSRRGIWGIVKGKTWKHIPRP